MGKDYDKKYYWIKLKTNFFDLPAIEWLLEQENGSDYVVLYQMLCLKAANTNGKLSQKIGEMIIPYNIKKIARDCKYFTIDTVTVALKLYEQLGLIYAYQDGVLCISDYESMVGSETSSAKRVREHRAKNKQIEMSNTTMIETEKEQKKSTSTSNDSDFYCESSDLDL